MTRRVLVFLVGLTGVAFAVPASAQPDKLDCGDTSFMSQSEMTDCAWQEFEAADKRLNTLWPTVVGQAKDADRELKEYRPDGDGQPGYEETLRQAQRSWVAYRDANCLVAGFEARGGSMQPMLEGFCQSRMTSERIVELLYDFGEDGLSDLSPILAPEIDVIRARRAAAQAEYDKETKNDNTAPR